MFIDRPSFIQGSARSQGNVASAYNTGSAAPVGVGRGKAAVTSDTVSTTNIGALAGALHELSSSGDQRIEALRELYASGQYTMDTGALAGKLADRILGGRE